MYWVKVAHQTWEISYDKKVGTHIVGLVILIPEVVGNRECLATLQIRRAFCQDTLRCTLDVSREHTVLMPLVELVAHAQSR